MRLSQTFAPKFALLVATAISFPLAALAQNTNIDSDKLVDFPATILRELGRDTLEVRGGNGHVYKVMTNADSEQFNAGAEVRVVGFAVGLDVEDAYLVDRRETRRTNAPRYQEAREVDFPAVILGVDLKRMRAVVKGDDGNTYRLRGDEIEEFHQGDRVRVRGMSRYGVVELRTLDFID